jgi:hypothetical protein
MTTQTRVSSRLSLVGKVVALFVIVALLIRIVSGIAGFHLPNVGDFLRGGVHKTKQTADDVVADVSHRTAEPLKVKPEDVVKGAIEGRVSYGEAQRLITILDASKKYNSPLPWADEWIHLRGGQYIGAASVPGPVSWTVKDTTVSVMLQPSVYSDLMVKQEPTDSDDRQPIVAAGQAVGSPTKTKAARDELDAYVRQLITSDTEIANAASCWGIVSVKQLLQPAFTIAGYDVVEAISASQVGEAARDDASAKPKIVLDIKAFSTLKQGEFGPPTPLNEASCSAILQKTTVASSGVGPAFLEPNTIASLRLKQA